jgi:hypothetical protein
MEFDVVQTSVPYVKLHVPMRVSSSSHQGFVWNLVAGAWATTFETWGIAELKVPAR